MGTGGQGVRGLVSLRRKVRNLGLLAHIGEGFVKDSESQGIARQGETPGVKVQPTAG